MTDQLAALSDDLDTLLELPAWVTSGRAETLETVAFRSGAGLTVLDALATDPTHGVPVKLLANRLALSAATATSKLEGRLVREADIRDAYHLTPPGEARGPDGDILAFWRDAARLKLTGRDWHVSVQGLVGAAFADDVLRGDCYVKLRVRRMIQPLRGEAPMPAPKNPFKRHRFPRDIILQAVRWYCRFALSYRDVKDLLEERGVHVDAATIYRWVRKFGPEIAKRSFKHKSCRSLGSGPIHPAPVSADLRHISGLRRAANSGSICKRRTPLK